MKKRPYLHRPNVGTYRPLGVPHTGLLLAMGGFVVAVGIPAWFFVRRRHMSEDSVNPDQN